MNEAQQETAQDNYLEGQVSDFDYAIARGNWAEALEIIKELRGQDFEEPANRLAQELARKRLNEN